jgi:hypothetical protein
MEAIENRLKSLDKTEFPKVVKQDGNTTFDECPTFLWCCTFLYKVSVKQETLIFIQFHVGLVRKN